MSAAVVRALKAHQSFEQQPELLVSRGLIVGDEGVAKAALARYGYYRLSGYFYPLRRSRPAAEAGREDRFVEGASMDLVIELVEFDKQLRLLCLHAIESLEIAARVAVAHRLGRIDPEAHLHARLFDRRFGVRAEPGTPSPHEQWCERFEALRAKSREDFVQHHDAFYGGRMPVWVAAQLWDFGTLSRLISGLQFRDRQALAQGMGLADGEVLKSWLRSFLFIRNVAAHHARLWNRVSPAIPSLPALERCRWLEPLHRRSQPLNRIFAALTCLRVLLRTTAPTDDWHRRLHQLVAAFPRTPLLSIRSAGFPDEWVSFPVWR